jgi:hypothetical protein
MLVIEACWCQKVRGLHGYLILLHPTVWGDGLCIFHQRLSCPLGQRYFVRVVALLSITKPPIQYCTTISQLFPPSWR